MERLAYPTNVMQEMGIDVTEITDETRQNFAKLLDNGVISDRLTYCIKEYYRNNRTLEDLASELNVTRERVRQLIASAKEKLTTYRPYILGIDGCVHDGWLILSDFRDTFDELYLYNALRSEHIQHQFPSSQ